MKAEFYARASSGFYLVTFEDVPEFNVNSLPRYIRFELIDEDKTKIIRKIMTFEFLKFSNNIAYYFNFDA